MSDFLKKIGKKLLWIMITFVLLEVLLLLALEAIYLLSEYKLDISVDLALNQFSNMFSNIVTVISNYINEKNPFFILGTVAIFIYSIILQKGDNKKDGWESQLDTAYHGSAHWGKNKDIFDKKNFHSQSKRSVQKDFMNSLKIKGE